MKKIDVHHVAAGILYLKDDRHSDSITHAIVDSDLSVLGYKGRTPEKTILSRLRRQEFFEDGTEKSHIRLGDRTNVLDILEVRLAIFAVTSQLSVRQLRFDNIVEFTFIGGELCGVRNPHALLSTEEPKIRKVIVPTAITIKEIADQLNASNN